MVIQEARIQRPEIVRLFHPSLRLGVRVVGSVRYFSRSSLLQRSVTVLAVAKLEVVAGWGVCEFSRNVAELGSKS